jgi:hypothetical protein
MMWQATGQVDFAAHAAMSKRAAEPAGARRAKMWHLPGVSWRNG